MFYKACYFHSSNISNDLEPNNNTMEKMKMISSIEKNLTNNNNISNWYVLMNVTLFSLRVH